ncbi:EF-P lysine aminoacylase EpmA [Pseudotabrizicola algicola]|uniref:EF-P lysine aminoacylase GenX n=1 Tax=Pseudotabrizicola algicola TaxID=2709381 RepID=A0A6B3RNV7_9RHOB|nr:EF-P lysine aminoacylase EpmA [Pseudotabrizicola algicola]NEX44769.1 EF-P lysine aminoacylase GenX [Pseudotabrizicola algicola]
MPDNHIWWSPPHHADRRPVLLARNRIQAALRAYLAGEDFVEVDPACLQISPGNETHLHAFGTQAIGNDGEARRMYLHTSPEFAMKKLLAAGETRIHAFAHVWRNRERGALHSPEFTMLEWYRVGQDYTSLMADCIGFLQRAAQVTGTSLLRFRNATCDPMAAPERLSVAEAMRRHAGVDLLSTLTAQGAADRDALARQAEGAGVRVAEGDTWSDVFSRLLAERVEPHLGHGRPTLLDRYPVVEAALARPCPDDPREAERFELYACGVELANGFGELTDPAEQRRRFQSEMEEKARLYGERYPLDEDFLSALAHMPEASGCAMGFDRLVMLATGVSRIDGVLWTPVA